MSAETPIRFNPTSMSVWRCNEGRATICTEARGPWPAKWARVLVSRCVGVETAFLVRVGQTTRLDPPAPTYPRSISSFFTPRLPTSVRSQPTHKRHFPSLHPSTHPSFTYPYPYACVSSEPLTSDSPTAHQRADPKRFLRCARMPSGEKLDTTHDNSKARGFGVCALCGPRGRYT